MNIKHPHTIHDIVPNDKKNKELKKYYKRDKVTFLSHEACRNPGNEEGEKLKHKNIRQKLEKNIHNMKKETKHKNRNKNSDRNRIRENKRTSIHHRDSVIRINVVIGNSIRINFVIVGGGWCGSGSRNRENWTRGQRYALNPA